MSPSPIRFAPVLRPRPVDLPSTKSASDSVLAFSYNKAGSTMFNRILAELCRETGLTFVSVPAMLFARGIDPRLVDVEVDVRSAGYCYAGFRFYPDYNIPILGHARTTLLVRDPRDALVSAYYSIRYSHVIPAQDGALRRGMMRRRAAAVTTTIDTWVMENHGAVVQSLAGYLAQGFLWRSNVAIYRYEDIIFRKREWIRDVTNWYGWSVDDKTIGRIVEPHDVFPAIPDPANHIRQVRPGNFRTALQPATQQKLSAQLEQYLTRFGYDTTFDAEEPEVSTLPAR